MESPAFGHMLILDDPVHNGLAMRSGGEETEAEVGHRTTPADIAGTAEARLGQGAQWAAAAGRAGGGDQQAACLVGRSGQGGSSEGGKKQGKEEEKERKKNEKRAAKCEGRKSERGDRESDGHNVYSVAAAIADPTPSIPS